MDIVSLRIHQSDNTVNEVAHVTESPGLCSVAIDRKFVTAESLDDEIRYHASVVFEHTFAVSIKDTDDTGIDFVLPVVIHHQSFGYPLPFIITSTKPQRVHVTPVVFGLRVDQRITVHFTSRSLEDPCLNTFC